jgi:2-haloacid dehalogenase
MQKLPLGPVRAITFDMYGTLLDLVASFASGFDEFLKSKGYAGSADDVIQAWETTYLHESNVDSLLNRPRTPFEVVRRVTLSQLFHKLKISHTEDDIEQLVTTKATPTLFPDVKEHLARLQTLGKYRVWVLSNGDLASLDRAVSALGIPVNGAISAEQAGYYKPHAGVYQHAIKELGLPANRYSTSRPTPGTYAAPERPAWPGPTSTATVSPMSTPTAPRRTWKCPAWLNWPTN